MPEDLASPGPQGSQRAPDATQVVSEARPGGEPERPAELEQITGRRFGGREIAIGLIFLLPALIVLGAIVVYPIFFTVWRSFYDRLGDTFIGLDNYREMFTRPSTLISIKNMVIWVVVAPFVATVLGLMFAVLTERIALGTAFKTIIFLPMAVSFLASGVIFRLAFEASPERGLANAMLTTVASVWQHPGPYRDSRPSDTANFENLDPGFQTMSTFGSGDVVKVAMVALPTDRVPHQAALARIPSTEAGAITGVVWLDFSKGGAGQPGVIDPNEVGLPDMAVRAIDRSGSAVSSAKTMPDGTFTLAGIPPGEQVKIELAPQSFKPKWQGIIWLGTRPVTPIGPAIVTISIIIAFLWIWAGFAMMLIAAGLSSMPEEVQEAARVDGATEWQVFRRVTVPLLWPVLMVVLVTLVINVLKIFDLILIIPPGSSQADANVIALELWRVSFGGGRDQGLGSALGVFLFLLVVPVIFFNIRRFRSDEG
ncbi:MAG: ABC transporter permease subunit [Acidimicrobiia bacterium]|nr:ABC transporter permease subunit [Acidimicrobiia bacterium]